MVAKTKTKKTRKRAPKALPGEVIGEMNGFPVRRVQAGALTGADYNPRRITDEALASLRASTEKFGLVQPIIWNKRTNRLVGGHQRLKTLEPGDYTDVLEVDLSLDEEKALNLALNNPHASGEFTTALGDILQDLEISIPDITMDLGLDKLYTNVPATMDDLLDDVTDDTKPDEGEATKSPIKSEGAGKVKNDLAAIKQIVIVVDDEEHTEAIRGLEVVMRNESLENYTEALLWLLKSYQAPKSKKRTSK